MSLKVTQVKSGSGSTERQLRTLKGLGLGKIGRSRVVKDDAPTRGMITKVQHLVKVEEATK